MTTPITAITLSELEEQKADYVRVVGREPLFLAASPTVFQEIRDRFQSQQRFRPLVLAGTECLLWGETLVVADAAMTLAGYYRFLLFPEGIEPPLIPRCDTCGHRV